VSVILASSSPFRKALLKKLGIDFETVSPNINEEREKYESPFELVKRLAEQKAIEVSKFHSGLVIGSDQVATLGSGMNIDDKIFTKPGSHDNAVFQLKNCSGKTVTFLTGLTLLNTKTKKIQVHVEKYKVTFKKLTESEILNYLKKEDALNCAGSFKSEGLGIALFKNMEGNDPNSLIGLPVIELIKMLAKENVHIL